MFGILGKRKQGAYRYSQAFWLLFWSVGINRMTASMIWPFLTVYMYQVLNVPLTTVTLLLTLRGFFSVLSTTITSPLMDRIGRKQVMIWGLVASALVFFAMARAESLLVWAVIIAAHGTVIPIFNIGVNAMVADLVPRENRAPAYALIRTISNVGIAIGPVVGGLLATVSFALAFNAVGVAYLGITALTIFFIPETRPDAPTDSNNAPIVDGGYREIVRDWHYMGFLASYFIMTMGVAHIFSLLPVYVSENFGLVESQYSLILTVNAGMVVLFQYVMTRFTDRYRPFHVITVGALLYALGLLSVAAGSVLWHFMLSMAIATLGELMIAPTANTLVANIAPDHMRARYLGLLNLGYPIGAGFGPVIGGLLNDNIAPVAIWYGAAVMAGVGMIGFYLLSWVGRGKRHDSA